MRQIDGLKMKMILYHTDILFIEFHFTTYMTSDAIEISAVILLSNFQSIGPFYISDSGVIRITPDIGMLLAARLVITAGIGNTSAKTEELYGPLPMPELSDGDYLSYLFSMSMQQQPIPGSSFSTGKGSLIFSIVFEDKLKDKIYNHKNLIESILREHSSDLNFSNTVTGMISPEIKGASEELLKMLYSKINNAIELAEKYRGASLFDIGFLVSLPDELNFLAKKLIQQPNGWREKDISDKDNLMTLLSYGLVRKENREDGIWFIPV